MTADKLRDSHSVLARAVVTPFFHPDVVLQDVSPDLAQMLPAALHHFLPASTKTAMVG